MAQTTVIEIIGLPHLQTFFKSTAPNDLERGINDGLAQISEAIENVTTSLAPVDTGFMKSEIRVTHTNDSIEAHAGADYSSYVDEGTSRMSAQPFFTEPIKGIVEGISQAITTALSKTGIFSE